jgi:hypothetical protein
VQQRLDLACDRRVVGPQQGEAVPLGADVCNVDVCAREALCVDEVARQTRGARPLRVITDGANAGER